MKLIKVCIVLLFISIICFANNNENTKLVITLDIVRAFDNRLPKIHDKDFKQILDEFKRIINIKLTDDIIINFNDKGIITLDELFLSTDYQNNDWFEEYFKPYKYDIQKGKKHKLFHNKNYKNRILSFLKNWKLDNLKGFVPDKTINSYEDLYEILMDTYHKKIEWLKSLKINDNTNLVINPLPPYQSYVEWVGFMYEQNKYDVIISNTLMVLDLASEPHPHSIFKHAKVGGSEFTSPKRKVLHGRSLMMNIFELYGDVKDICVINPQISRELKNKTIAGYGLAHEFGHAFFMIPDVYDHGDSCLMNSSLDNLDYIKGYELLIKELTQCKKCQPWIIAKKYIIEAEILYKNKNYKRAGELFLKGAKATPRYIVGDYKLYIKTILKKAYESYKKINDTNGMKLSVKVEKELL